MATTATTLSDSAWTEVSTGVAALLETDTGHEVYIHFGAIAPAVDTAARHKLFGPASLSYGGSQNCYARAAHGTPTIIVTV